MTRRVLFGLGVLTFAACAFYGVYLLLTLLFLLDLCGGPDRPSMCETVTWP